jgi:hypothetical protein
MDFSRTLTPEERYTLGTIARHHEIDEWVSDKVELGIIRSIAGGYGTVYCVLPTQAKLSNSL